MSNVIFEILQERRVLALLLIVALAIGLVMVQGGPFGGGFLGLFLLHAAFPALPSVVDALRLFLLGTGSAGFVVLVAVFAFDQLGELIHGHLMRVCVFVVFAAILRCVAVVVLCRDKRGYRVGLQTHRGRPLVSHPLPLDHRQHPRRVAVVWRGGGGLVPRLLRLPKVLSEGTVAFRRRRNRRGRWPGETPARVCSHSRPIAE